MPKKNSKPIATKQPVTTKKLIAAAKKQADQDLVEQWRLLRAIGAYNTKETASAKKLTDARIRAIKKHMKEINKKKKLVKGKTVRPIRSAIKTFKNGKTKLVYEISPHYAFTKTKHKPKVSSVRTKKGVIVEKSFFADKVKVLKNGDIVEYRGKLRSRRTRYSGDDLLKLIDKFDKGTYKFGKHDIVVLHNWGAPASQISSEPEAAQMISNYIRGLQRSMVPEQFQRYVEASYIEFITVKEDATVSYLFKYKTAGIVKSKVITGSSRSDCVDQFKANVEHDEILSITKV